MNDFENPGLAGLNRLPARAYFFPFADELSALESDRGGSPWFASLNGTWKFCLSATVAEVPERFFANDFNPAGWGDLVVPGNWQLQGHGHPNYTNVQYPFPVDPPRVPTVGSLRAGRWRLRVAPPIQSRAE